MGNKQNNLKDINKKDQKENVKGNNGLYMHIQFVGKDLINFYNNLIASEKLKCIKDFWNFEKIEENLSITEQINNYFKFLENQKKDEKRDEKETFIIKVKNISEQVVNHFLEEMNKLE